MTLCSLLAAHAAAVTGLHAFRAKHYPHGTRVSVVPRVFPYATYPGGLGCIDGTRDAPPDCVAVVFDGSPEFQWCALEDVSRVG